MFTRIGHMDFIPRFLTVLVLTILLYGCTDVNSYINQTGRNKSSCEILYRTAKMSVINPKIAIYQISSSLDMKGLENRAATSIYEALLKKFSSTNKNNEFNRCISSNFMLDIYNGQSNLESIFEAAKAKKYNYVMLIDGLAALEGSDISSSYLAEQVRIYNAAERKLLLHVKAQEYRNPTLSNDYIFFTSKAKSSPSISTLMNINSEKIVNAICNEGGSENN